MSSAAETLAVGRARSDDSESVAVRTKRNRPVLFTTGSTFLSSLDSEEVSRRMGTEIAARVQRRGNVDTSSIIEGAFRRSDAFRIGEDVIACSTFPPSDQSDTPSGCVSSSPPLYFIFILLSLSLLILILFILIIKFYNFFFIINKNTKKHINIFVSCSIIGIIIYWLFSIYLSTSVSTSVSKGIEEDILPPSFDCRSKWPITAVPPTDQGSCGNCWVIATADVLSARATIARGAMTRIDWKDIAISAKADDACKGGMLGAAMNAAAQSLHITLKQDADVDAWYDQLRQSCSSREGADTESLSAMRHSCVASAPFLDIGSAARILPYNISRIKRALMRSGPVAASMICTSSLRSYLGGVWYPTGARSDVVEGGHSVKIIGWTTVDVMGELNVPAWIIQNSWGSGFGSSFFLRRDAPEFGKRFFMSLRDDCQLDYDQSLLRDSSSLGGCFLLRISDSDDIFSPVCSMIEFEAFDPIYL